MRAGDLDRRVQFRRAALVDDGFEQVQQWADLGAPVWAGRRDVSDGERAAAGWVEATLVSRFTVRAFALTKSVTPADRLVESGREFQILGIKQLGREGLEITAMAVS